MKKSQNRNEYCDLPKPKVIGSRFWVIDLYHPPARRTDFGPDGGMSAFSRRS